jgi:heptosyltransferase-2
MVSMVSTVTLGSAPRLLVVKLASAGDVLLMTPSLRALRQRYPDAKIDVLTTQASAPLLAASSLVERVYTLDKYAFDTPRQIARRPWRLLGPLPLLTRLRANRYDAALLMHHLTLRFGALKYVWLMHAIGARRSAGLDNGRGGFLDVRVPDNGFGAVHEAEYGLALAAALDATLPEDERGLRLADLGWTLPSPANGGASTQRMIALHAGSGNYSVARRWPEERFAELAAALHVEWDAEIVLVGAADERDLNERILDRMGRPAWARDTAGQTPPPALAALLCACMLFVGNDSFPMHLAAAARTPVVAVFGPTNERAWGPYAPGAAHRIAVVRRDGLACSPCMYRGHALGTPHGCPNRPCLTELGIAPALAAARRLLGRSVSPAARGG